MNSRVSYSRNKIENAPLYRICIRCSDEIVSMMDKYFSSIPDDESKIKFLELLENKNKCMNSTPGNINFMLVFLEENKNVFKKHINLFNYILCLKSYLTDGDIKTDTPLSVKYFYELEEPTVVCPNNMTDETSYTFYHISRYLKYIYESYV